MRDMAAFIPLKRLCNIDEIGDLVAFLASDDSKYITGTETTYYEKYMKFA